MSTDPPDVRVVEFAEVTSAAMLANAVKLRIITLWMVGASVDSIRETIADEVAIAANFLPGD